MTAMFTVSNGYVGLSNQDGGELLITVAQLIELTMLALARGATEDAEVHVEIREGEEEIRSELESLYVFTNK